MFCSSCGEKIPDGSRFCSYCGAALVAADGLDAGKDQKASALIPYRKGEKWGLCDRDKKMVVPVAYGWAGVFKEGLALVRVDGKIGYIDTKGTQYWGY